MNGEITPSNHPPSQPCALSKVPTQIRGLDAVLHGGIPQGSLTLLVGGPGAGKTMLGLEFLVRGAEAGHPGVLLTFEEKEVALRRYGQGFGWDIAALEAQGRLALISARFDPDAVLSGDFDLRGSLAILAAKAEAISATRLFIDAPDVVLRLLDDLTKERAQLHAMNEWLQDKGLTVVLTVKGNTSGPAASHYDFLEYMADCVMYLDQRVYDQISTRRMRVVKYRGSSFSRNEYPFSITGKGLWIIPVTQTSLQHQALGDSLSSGVTGLDAVLDGGYRRNSCVLISGHSGTGKTTFACSFATSVITQGERLLYLNFEESWDALVSCMNSPGIDLPGAHASGNLRFVSTMPESQGIEEHLIQVFNEIEEFQPGHLIVDAISACRRMGSTHAAFDYLLRLMDHCKQRGITALLTNLTASPEPANEITGIDLSSAIDAVIMLRNVEREGRFVRELAILKSRGRAHSHLIHEFQITNRGIVIAAKEDAHDR